MKWINHFPNDVFHVDYFVNPIPALAVLGMAVNDHWLKNAYPSWLTGKLSDFLGVFYFPIFVCALICLSWNFMVRPFMKTRIAYITNGLMGATMGLTAILMIGIKLSPTAAQQVQLVFSSLLFDIHITPDPTDLVALLSLPLSYAYARQFINYRIQ